MATVVPEYPATVWNVVYNYIIRTVDSAKHNSYTASMTWVSVQFSGALYVQICGFVHYNNGVKVPTWV